jgi:hypothetical protein
MILKILKAWISSLQHSAHRAIGNNNPLTQGRAKRVHLP